MPLYFLKDDFEKLNEEIERLEAKFRARSKTAADLKNPDQSDSFGLGGVENDLEVDRQRISELRAFRREAIAVEVNESNERVSIGKKVTVRDEDTGQVTTFVVGSYRTFNKVNTFSYDGPRIKSLLMAKVGERKEVKLENDTRSYVVLNIE